MSEPTPTPTPTPTPANPLGELGEVDELETQSATKFEVPDLPTTEPFTLTLNPAPPATAPHPYEDADTATVLGPFQPEEFITDPATNATYAHIPPAPDESPDNVRRHIVLRVVEQYRDPANHENLYLHCLDDNNNQITYFVQVVPDNVLEAEL